MLLHSCHPACQHHLQLSSYSAKLFNGGLLITVAGKGAATDRRQPRQAAAGAGRAGAPATTPATSVRARPRGSTSRAPGAASLARAPSRRARLACRLVLSPRAAPVGAAAAGSTGAGWAGCSANQARQQNENA